MELLKSVVRKRASSTIPFGYNLHPKNPSLIVENPAELKVLHEIRPLSDSHSLRQLIEIVKGKTGKTLSPRGMQKLLKRAY